MTKLRRRHAAMLGVPAGLLVLLLAAVELPGRRANAALVQADPATVLDQPALRRTATRIGRKIYATRCAGCHGADGTGDRIAGVPDLTDGEHLYGRGAADEIEEIVRHGIRAGDPRGWDLASMPAFASARPYRRYTIASLTPRELDDVTAYVRALAGHRADPQAAARGGVVFGGRGECFDCHSFDGKGDPYAGAPDLTDAVWLYGDGSAAAIRRSIASGRAGVCPSFENSLSPLETRAVSAYVAALGRMGPPVTRRGRQ